MRTEPDVAGPFGPGVRRGREGGTELWLPAAPARRGPGERAPIFYNPAMALDRDLNVAVARRARSQGAGRVAAWEMLGATGVRGLRLVAESDWLDSLEITELHPRALEVARENAARLGASIPIAVAAHDARRPRPDGRRFGYVDLDPYGSPLPYLATLWTAVDDPAIVGVTATDTMVLAGATRGACERLYRARPVHGRLGPEGGLRILIASLVESAAAAGWRARPLLSYVHDHHLRTYLTVRRSEGDPPSSVPIGTIEEATWAGPSLGPGAPFGPLWLGPLAEEEWVRGLEVPATAARPDEARRFLARLREEAAVDTPFYYEPNELARALHLREPLPTATILAGLRGSGARAARGHPRESAIRTDAPRPVVLALVRRLAESR